MIDEDICIPVHSHLCFYMALTLNGVVVVLTCIFAERELQQTHLANGASDEYTHTSGLQQYLQQLVLLVSKENTSTFYRNKIHLVNPETNNQQRT